MAIYIPPVGTKREPIKIKPVALPSRALTPRSADNVLQDAKVPVILRQTKYSEAKTTGIELDIEALLAKHPLPPTPLGKPFILDPWQIEDIATLVQWTRVGMFLPVGAGKTVIGTLVALSWGADYNLIVALPILVPQWVEWLNSVGGSGGAVDYRGTPKKRMAMDLKAKKWWVMSFQVFKNDFSHLQKLLHHHSLTTFVDEAQNIKNSETGLHKAVAEISIGRNLLLATGTELASPADAYGYIKLKTPGVYQSYLQFTRIHVEKEDFFGKPIAWRELQLLSDNLYLNSVKRTEEEVKRLTRQTRPEGRYIPLQYELSEQHEKMYELLEAQCLVEDDGEGGKVDASTSQTLRFSKQELIMAPDRFLHLLEPRPKEIEPAFHGAIDYVLDAANFSDPGSGKIILWTWFKLSTKAVAAYMESKFPGQGAIAFSETNASVEVARFMKDPNCRWLVAQPGSAGAGLNPQYVCRYSLFLELPSSVIAFRQAAGRTDRTGQPYEAVTWLAYALRTIQADLFIRLMGNDKLVRDVEGGETLGSKVRN